MSLQVAFSLTKRYPRTFIGKDCTVVVITTVTNLLGDLIDYKNTVAILSCGLAWARHIT